MKRLHRVVSVVVLLAVLLAMVPVMPATAQGSWTCTHTVQSGEILANVAPRYGTTAAEVARQNGLRNQNFIWVSQKLKVPCGSSWVPSPVQNDTRQAAGSSVSQSGNGVVHIVQRGENLSIIATRYGKSVQAFVQANNLRNANAIYVGQKLIVPATGASANFEKSWSPPPVQNDTRKAVVVGVRYPVPGAEVRWYRWPGSENLAIVAIGAVAIDGPLPFGDTVAVVIIATAGAGYAYYVVTPHIQNALATVYGVPGVHTWATTQVNAIDTSHQTEGARADTRMTLYGMVNGRGPDGCWHRPAQDGRDESVALRFSVSRFKSGGNWYTAVQFLHNRVQPGRSTIVARNTQLTGFSQISLSDPKCAEAQSVLVQILRALGF